MIDPFNPVMITKKAMQLEVDQYYLSWGTKKTEVVNN